MSSYDSSATPFLGSSYGDPDSRIDMSIDFWVVQKLKIELHLKKTCSLGEKETTLF
jgi:hypothetical protein